MRKIRWAKFQKDNKGSVMILVLVCMFMVSLIGAMILSATMINYRMKTSQQMSAENFYSAEAVMEELTAEMRKNLLTAYGKAYEDLLLNYLDETVAEDRQKYFMLSIVDELGLYPDEKSAGYYVSTSQGFLATLKEALNIGLGTRGSVSFADSNAVIIEVPKQQIRVKDVRLSFADESGYRTELKTDLVLTIAMPDAGFEKTEITVNRYMDNYVIISDSDIISNSAGTEGEGKTIAYVDGSIYAGMDLRVNAGLSLNGDRVVLGNNLELLNGSSFSSVMGELDNDGIWARNIVLDGGELRLSGDCYVVDDTTFNRSNSRMTITNGGYYGYSYSELAEGDPYRSSAIIVNKPNVTLDLSQAEMLWLAGNAYIREDNKIFNDIGTTVDGVLEGESIAYKNLQAAYMMPGCCIVGVEHNPIMMSQYFSKKQGEDLNAPYLISEAKATEVAWETEAEVVAGDDMVINETLYRKNEVIPAGTTIPEGTILPVGTKLPKGTVLPCDVRTPIIEMVLNKDPVDGSDFVEDGYYIDLTISKTELGIDLADYVDALKPVTVRYSNLKQMGYLYLRFLNPQNASGYLQDYLTTTTGIKLLEQLKTLGTAKILLPEPERVVALGNLTEYSYDAETGKADYGVVSTNLADNLLWREALLTSKYNALLSRLNPSGRMDSQAEPIEAGEESAFDYLINPVKFAEAAEAAVAGNGFTVQICTDKNGVEIPFCVVSKQKVASIELSDVAAVLGVENITNAVVITDGDVVADTGFSGIIIAKGDVMLNVSGKEKTISISEGITGLVSLMEHEVIGPYFNGYKAEKKNNNGDENQLQMTELIRMEFDGWVKN